MTETTSTPKPVKDAMFALSTAGMVIENALQAEPLSATERDALAAYLTDAANIAAHQSYVHRAATPPGTRRSVARMVAGARTLIDKLATPAHEPAESPLPPRS